MKKITATRNGETEQFTALAWRKMPKSKYGWKEVAKETKKPEPLQSDEPAKKSAKSAAKKKETKK